LKIDHLPMDYVPFEFQYGIVLNSTNENKLSFGIKKSEEANI